MTKISKQTKLKAILAYLSGEGSVTTVAHKYGLAVTPLRSLVAAYRTHGASVLFDLPTVNAEFRFRLVIWMIENKASYTQVAAKFGYVGNLSNTSLARKVSPIRARWVIVYCKRTKSKDEKAITK